MLQEHALVNWAARLSAMHWAASMSAVHWAASMAATHLHRRLRRVLARWAVDTAQETTNTKDQWNLNLTGEQTCLPLPVGQVDEQKWV